MTTKDSKIKIKDGIYGALNAYNNNILSLNKSIDYIKRLILKHFVLNAN